MTSVGVIEQGLSSIGCCLTCLCKPNSFQSIKLGLICSKVARHHEETAVKRTLRVSMVSRTIRVEAVRRIGVRISRIETALLKQAPADLDVDSVHC